jgi:hypothetical protein
MGRAAYVSGVEALPPAAREEAQQRQHENDDQDDPEDAQSSHLLRASSSFYNGITTSKVSQGRLGDTGASATCSRSWADPWARRARRRFPRASKMLPSYRCRRLDASFLGRR